MTSEELAKNVEEVIEACRGRILGVGKEQYDYGDTQRFETLGLAELLDWALEELDDQIVYMVMQRIRLIRIRDVISKIEMAAPQT